MKRKKYLAGLLAALLLTATGCSEPSPDPEPSAEPATEATTEEESQPETFEFEEEVYAAPGQAYLAIVDGQWWVQYWGDSERGTMLAYDAGVCDITGEGSYTVSVNADTFGFRYDTTNDPYGEYTPSGLNFAAVIIKDGETLCPDYVITIDSILIDGQEIEMTAKNYTSFEDGHIRSNIFNPYADAPTGDAKCANGMLFHNFDNTDPALDEAGDYSPQIVDVKDFLSWTKVEVNFTISLLPKESAEPANDEADEPETPAEDPDEPTEEEITEEATEETTGETTDTDLSEVIGKEISSKLSEVAGYREAARAKADEE